MKTQVQKTVLIEQTSKKFKLIRLAGLGQLLLAVVAAVLLMEHETASQVVGFTLAATGLATMTYGWALSWWHHG